MTHSRTLYCGMAKSGKAVLRDTILVPGDEGEPGKKSRYSLFRIYWAFHQDLPARSSAVRDPWTRHVHPPHSWPISLRLQFQSTVYNHSVGSMLQVKGRGGPVPLCATLRRFITSKLRILMALPGCKTRQWCSPRRICCICLAFEVGEKFVAWGPP